ncbi:MAG TPA: SurA N-terminal domain-containing protein [Bacteriovoracaceae bacterium]|nr:SurA N-terminal domain-containing protein [Bacteriovoracaceae bacterium]
MKTAFASKMSYFILTFLFLIIIASFLFSGFDNFSMSGAGKHVATVDGTPISTKEYQQALTRQIEFFNQMMGGKGGTLTAKQLEEMGIKQSVLNGLVQQKLILNAAEQMGFVVSLDEVKNEIKGMPFFKTQDRFDVNLYRNMLQGNGYIPTQFEELVANDLKQKKVDGLFNSTLISENFVKDVMRFKNNVVVLEGVKISRQSLAPLVSVSEQEIKDYLSKPENQKNLETIYTDNASKYNQAAEVKARHILIQGDDAKSLAKVKELKSKVNTKNFGEVAKIESQDPTGKANGGDLGWFSAGRMVPEFESVAFTMPKGTISDPVKTQFGYHLIYVEDKKPASSKPIAEVKEELARMAIQKTKAQDLDQLLKTETDRLSKALAANDLATIEATSKKVDGQVFKATEVNQYDQQLGQAPLSPAEADQIFKAEAGKVINFSNPGSIYLLKVVSRKENPEVTPEKLKAELTVQNQTFSRKVREELLRVMNNKAKVVTNPALL